MIVIKEKINIPEKLRQMACAAGKPWTADDPASDHGHTYCYYMHLAANEIDRLTDMAQTITNEVSYHDPVEAVSKTKHILNIEGFASDNSK